MTVKETLKREINELNNKSSFQCSQKSNEFILNQINKKGDLLPTDIQEVINCTSEAFPWRTLSQGSLPADSSGISINGLFENNAQESQDYNKLHIRKALSILPTIVFLIWAFFVPKIMLK